MALELPVCLTPLGRGGTGAPRPVGLGLLCKGGARITRAVPRLTTRAPREGPATPPPRGAPRPAPQLLEYK